jgi:hypothetical protein
LQAKFLSCDGRLRFFCEFFRLLFWLGNGLPNEKRRRASEQGLVCENEFGAKTSQKKKLRKFREWHHRCYIRGRKQNKMKMKTNRKNYYQALAILGAKLAHTAKVRATLRSQIFQLQFPRRRF